MRKLRANPFEYSRKLSMRLTFILITIFLYAPIVVLVIFSFNNSRRGGNVIWRGFTLDYYEKAFNNPALVEAFVNSLTIAFISTLVSVVLGAMTATFLWRFRFPLKPVTEGMVALEGFNLEGLHPVAEADEIAVVLGEQHRQEPLKIHPDGLGLEAETPVEGALEQLAVERGIEHHPGRAAGECEHLGEGLCRILVEGQVEGVSRRQDAALDGDGRHRQQLVLLEAEPRRLGIDHHVSSLEVGVGEVGRRRLVPGRDPRLDHPLVALLRPVLQSDLLRFDPGPVGGEALGGVERGQCGLGHVRLEPRPGLRPERPVIPRVWRRPGGAG